MDVYLLDTNCIIMMLRENDQRLPQLIARMAELPSDSHMCLATVTLAELEVGCASIKSNRIGAQEEIRGIIVKNKFDVLPFTKHTAAEYGKIKATLMHQYDRADRKNRAKWPENWTKPTSGAKLGADELDIMLVSHAVERNMVLVTTDRMNQITAALNSAEISLRKENWIA